MGTQSDYIEKLHMLPEHMRGAMQRWIELGPDAHCGSFMLAMLSGDLFEALSRADEENQRALPAYGIYLYNYAPGGCYGSPARVKAWRGLNAMADAA